MNRRKPVIAIIAISGFLFGDILLGTGECGNPDAITPPATIIPSRMVHLQTPAIGDSR